MNKFTPNLSQINSQEKNLCAVSKKLKNGLEIVIVPYLKQKSIMIHSWIFNGSAYETKEKNGISHFLEHMMFRGNKKLGDTYQLNLSFEELGGEMNASTSTNCTEYWLQFHKNFKEEGIRRFCQFLSYPHMERLDIERSIILEEYKDHFDDEGYLTNVDSLSANALWPNQSMGMPIIGTEENLTKFNQEDLIDWYQKYYYPGNMILGITGHVDAHETFKWVEDEFKDFKFQKRKSYSLPQISIQKEEQVVLVPHRDNQFSFQWSFPIKMMDPILRVQFQLINRILDDGFSSRLQRLIREERGLVYDISAGMEFFENSGVLAIHGVIGIERLFELTEHLTNLIQEFADKGITEEEWNLVTKRYQIMLDYRSDFPQGILSDVIGPNIFAHLRPLKETFEILNQLTIEDLNTTIKKYFFQKETVLVLVGPVQKGLERKIKEDFKSWLI